MLQRLFEKIEKHEYKDLKGSHIHLTLPIHKNVLNHLIRPIYTDSEYIEHIEITDINTQDISIKVNIFQINLGIKQFELVDRIIRLRVIDAFRHPDFTLQFQILEGLNRVERKLIDILLTRFLTVKGLTMDGDVLFVNLSEMTPVEEYAHITHLMKQESLKMTYHKLVYQFDLDFRKMGKKKREEV